MKLKTGGSNGELSLTRIGMMNLCPLRGRSSVICLKKRPRRRSLLKGLRIQEAKVVLLSTRRPKLQPKKVALMVVQVTISKKLQVR
jgi:hypothetical protein